jgi:uncharacterized membrane protein YozB (DUF420 family)
MSTLAASGQALPSGKRKTPYFAAKVLGFAVVLGVALFFVRRYVFFYYLHYNQQAFEQGASNHWAMRGWLLMHITGGMMALLVGPWQFWTGYRMRYAKLHRWTGRVFLCSVAIGAIGAFRLIFVTTGGWAFGVGLFGLALAWVTTAGMAYYAILQGRVAIHKEWMVRAYVVTFAFVTFRIITDYGPTSHLKPEGDLAVTAAWACWAVPLLVTEVILQLRRMHTAVL